jgi:hypothetical protein
VGQLHAETRARKRETRRHAAQTGRFVGQLHDKSQARNRDMRRHAAQTGRFVGQLHAETRARKRDAQEHATETARLVGQLHDESRARQRDMRRHAADTGRFVRYLHRATRQRKREVGQLLGQTRELIAGLGVITRDAQAEWRRQLVAIDSGRRAASAGHRASPRGGTAVAEVESKAGVRGRESNRNAGGRVLTYVGRHPGTRLPEMERALRISRIESARTVHALLEQGKIRRDQETRQYFPA